MNFQKLAEFLHFFFVYKTQKHNPIALKFGTLKGMLRAHPDAKFGFNTMNGHEVIKNYSGKITPICCHAKSLLARS